MEFHSFGSVDELYIIQLMSFIMISSAVAVLFILQFVTTPYGRYAQYKHWGFGINAKVAWIVQELPSLVMPLLVLTLSSNKYLKDIPNFILMSMFILHYFQRAILYPLFLQGGKPTPFIPFVLAFIFCIYNGYLQARSLLNFTEYPENYIYGLNFPLGTCLFFIGMLINLHSDSILRNLRSPGETGYKIPRGGAFEFVSGANFFGECLEWFGFAVAAWNLPSTAFAIFTICNIGPRAFHHHRWYLEKFEDYPKARKSLIPFVF